MNALVIGGAASGKSEFAENLALSISQKLNTPLVYLATLDPNSGGDTEIRICRHRRNRSGKGFLTVELLDFSSCAELIPENSAVLVEDFGNLVARAMFGGGVVESAKENTEKSLGDFIERIIERASSVVAVTNDVFSENPPSPELEPYLKALSAINSSFAEKCGSVFRIVAGIPIRMK